MVKAEAHVLAVSEVIEVLHADKLGPAVLLSDELECGELVRPHRRGINVSDFSLLKTLWRASMVCSGGTLGSSRWI